MADNRIVIDTKMENRGIIKGVRDATRQLEKVTEGYKGANAQIQLQKDGIQRLNEQLSAARQEAVKIGEAYAKAKAELPTKRPKTDVEAYEKQRLEVERINQEYREANKNVSSLSGELRKSTLELNRLSGEASSYQFLQTEAAEKLVQAQERLVAAQSRKTAAIKEETELVQTSQNTWKAMTAEEKTHWEQSEEAARLSEQNKRAEIEQTNSAISETTQHMAEQTQAANNLNTAFVETGKTVFDLKREFAETTMQPLRDDLESARLLITEISVELKRLQAAGEAHKGIVGMQRTLEASRVELDKLESTLIRAETFAEIDFDISPATKAMMDEVKSGLDDISNGISEVGERAKITVQPVNNFSSSMQGARISARQMGAAFGMAIGGAGSLRGIISSLSGMIFMMGESMNAAKIQATAMWAAITLGVSLAVNAITKVIESFGKLKDEIEKTVEDIAKGFIATVGKIGAATKSFIGFIKNVINTIPKFNIEISKMGKGIANLATSIIKLGKQTTIFNQLQTSISDVTAIMRDWIVSSTDFQAALNMIRVNLLTAFAPIIETVAPLLIMLIQLVSQATAALAQFIALLFGTSYEKSKASAKAIYDQAKAIKKLGQEVQKILAPFDELIILSEKSAGADVDPWDFDFEMPDLPLWMTNLTEWLAPIFESLKGAWDSLLDSLITAFNNWKDKLLKAWKELVGEIQKLLTSIIDTFARLFQSDAWKKALNEIMRFLRNVMKLITSIAKAFREAWNLDDAGLKMLEAITNMIASIFGLINDIIEAFITAWDSAERGRRIFSLIFSIITNIANTITNIIEGIRAAWNKDGLGVRIWQQILDIAINILTVIDNITAATSEWAKGVNWTPLLTAIHGLLEAFNGLLGVIGPKFENAWKTYVLPFFTWLIELGAPSALGWITDKIKELANYIENTDWNKATLIGVIADVFQALSDNILEALDWISKNFNFGDWLNSIFADEEAWGKLGKTVGGLITGLLDFIIKQISTFDPEKASAALKTFIDSFIERINKEDFADKAAELVNKIVDALLTLIKAIPMDKILEIAKEIVAKIDWNKVWELMKEVEALKKLPGKIMDMFVSSLVDTTVTKALEKVGITWGDRIVAGWNRAKIPDGKTYGEHVIDGLAKGVQQKEPTIVTIFKNLANKITGTTEDELEIQSPSKVFMRIGTNIMQGLINGINSLINSVTSKAKEIATNITNAFSGAVSKAKEIGGNIANAIGTGLNNAKNAVVNTAKKVAGAITGGTEDKFQIQSPSKVFMRIGEFLGQGLGIGFENTAGLIKSAFTDTIEDAGDDVDGMEQQGYSIGMSLLRGLELAYTPIVDFFRNLMADIQGVISASLPTIPQITIPQLPRAGFLDSATISSLADKGRNIGTSNAGTDNAVYMERLNRIQEQQEIQSSLLRTLIETMASNGGNERMDIKALTDSVTERIRAEQMRTGRGLGLA